jgi:PAS domain S-box-containing protein
LVARFQSDQQILTEEQLRFEALLADISAKFVNLPPDQVDHEIGCAQRLICESLGVDHSSVWQLPETGDTSQLILTHQYRDPNLPPLPALMSAKDFFPWALGKILLNEIVCIRNPGDHPPEAARDRLSYQQFGVRAGLGIPLLIEGRPPIGALSFESTRGERDWPDSLQKRLQLIARVFANAIDRKRADQKLLESEARLTLAAHSAGAGLWTLNPTNGRFWMTETTWKLFGLQPDEQLDFEGLLGMIHPEDSEAIRRVVVEMMLNGEEKSIEYRIIRPDGSVHWMASRGRRHSYNSNGLHLLMGVTTDITQRKRTEGERRNLRCRLSDAQEAERCRIARELHDDVGQSLSVLNLRIADTRDRLTALLGKSIPDFSELSANVAEISRKISSISHELHSSEFDVLGLVRAVKLVCDKWAKRHAISMDLVCDQIPGDIDRTSAISFFRIIQEALHNIDKHSGASHVEVRMTGSGSGLTLSIIDDGRGFDLERARVSPGLGLISMSERMEMIGGDFEIVSKPGEGTRIRAHVPIRIRTQQQVSG